MSGYCCKGAYLTDPLITNQLLYLLSYTSFDQIGRGNHLSRKKEWDFRECARGMQ